MSEHTAESDVARRLYNEVAEYERIEGSGDTQGLAWRVAQTVRRARAEAWDEGMRHGRFYPWDGPADNPYRVTPVEPCSTCGGLGSVPWMHESDPNLYQEPDADGHVPCLDCPTPPGSTPDGAA